MKAKNIIWSVDAPEELENLPTEMEIPAGMTDEDDISNYISDTTGFCHGGFSLELTVRDLTRNQLILLKQQHLLVSQGHVSWNELADVDNLVSDGVIFEEYTDTVFTEDDFPGAEE